MGTTTLGNLSQNYPHLFIFKDWIIHVLTSLSTLSTGQNTLFHRVTHEKSINN